MDWTALWAKLISSLDFTAIANGLLGIVLLLLSALGIRRGRQLKAEDKPEVTKTSIITTDSLSIDALREAVDNLNVTATEIAMLLRKEISDREIDEKIDAKVDERVERRLEARAAVRESRKTGDV